MPRLKAQTHKFDEVKRRHLTWNLADRQFEKDVIETGVIENEPEHSSLVPPKKKARRSKKNYLDLLEPELQELISQHDYLIPIKRRKDVKLNEVVSLLGYVDLHLDYLKAPYELPKHPEFWLYINEDDVKKSFIYFEKWDKKIDDSLTVHYFLVDRLPPLSLLSGLRIKQLFVLCLHDYEASGRKLTLGILLRKSGVTELHFPSEAPRIKPNAAIQNTIGFLYHISPPDYSAIKRIRKHDINALYAAVKLLRPKNVFANGDVQHNDLLPELRPYQVDAVRWMIEKERPLFGNRNEVHQLYQVIKTCDNKTFYYNKYGGYLVKKKPLSVSPKPGGILADEMGLGKTVEVLSCMLNNRRTDVLQLMEHQELGDKDYKFFEIDDLEEEEDDRTSSVLDADEEVAENLKNGLLFSPSFPSGSSFRQFSSTSSNNAALSLINARNSEVDSAMSDSINENPENVLFSCTCGAFETAIGATTQLQCHECGIWQHEKCVNYDKIYGKYHCLHCWVAGQPVPSRATLIVCPSSIHSQWVEEIQRHVRKDALKVFKYQGVFKCGFIQPPKLADNDIVITTYEILRKELHYVDLPHVNSEAGRKFRNPKRFMTIPSPLVAVEWWRICLDEAQMVESVTTKTAEMVGKLEAVNRWCITGTPIQKSVEDLYGLLLFLGSDPYSVKAWWRECLYEPYCYGDTEPMHKMLSKVLWRTAKVDVLDQIGLPEQTEEIHYLCFSPVEEYFYRQQHVECSREAVLRLGKVSDTEIKLSALDRNTLSNLLAPLLRLRQACCHPQAVRGQFMSIHKSTLTMEELLKSLIKKTKVEAEEAHRRQIAAINGLAGLNIIKHEWVEAVEKYRDVLRLADEEQENVKTDKMQRLHALHNLAELLDAGHQNVPPTLRDSSLKTEAAELRRLYLAKFKQKVDRAQETLIGIQETAVEVERQVDRSRNCWWLSAIDVVERNGRTDDLFERIRADLVVNDQPKRLSVMSQFRTVNGLKLVITNHLDSLTVAHDALAKAMSKLDLMPDQRDVDAAVECHLRPTEKKPPKCIYCRIDELFNKYEGRLFCFSTENEDRSAVEPDNSDQALMGPLRRGTWADSEVERMLKAVYAYSKAHNALNGDNEDTAIDIKLFDVWKKEFRALRGVWMQIRDYVSVVDELNMATIRLRLRFSDEPKPDPPVPNILEIAEVEIHKAKFMSDQIVSLNEKKKKLGQLLYLKNLAKSDLGKGKGNNPEPCPICQKALGEQWSVLQCGHCFCVECIQILMSRTGRMRSVKCAICRQTTTPGEISFINTKGAETDEQAIQVKGSYSTKVEGIVRTLLQIKAAEPDAKALVFSTWQDVLDVIAKALRDNEIKYCSLMSQHTRLSKFQESLEKFKKHAEVTVLLLPVQSGANGLNLIEATHILLVEPILNPASELQAVGRIHRIGQTKPTVVHRFLVSHTIEERMHTMLKSHCTGVSSHETEENTLTINDLRNLFTDD